MARPRKHNRHLPQGMYHKHGAYYLVRGGKWIRLGTELPAAMQEYTRYIQRPTNGVSQLLDRFLEDAQNRVKARTLDQYQRVAEVLRKVFQEFEVHQVEPRHIYQFMDHHRATPNWSNRALSVLKQAMDHAVLMGEIASNPAASVPRHKERNRDRYITDEEYSAIWQAAWNAGYQGPALAVIMELAYHTGQRIGDVLAIRRDDVIDEGIYFQTQKVGKKLLVAMTPELRQTINRALSLHGPTPKMYLLAQSDGRQRSYNAVRDLFDRYRNKAGVEDAHLHDLRAKSLTDAKKQGKDPQALGGHSTEQQTNAYLRSKETVVVEGPSFRQNGEQF
jgi:integrase